VPLRMLGAHLEYPWEFSFLRPGLK
jgi:hypothetical protein